MVLRILASLIRTPLYTVQRTLASVNSFHQDQFSWHLPSNTIKQLTKSANIRRFDISNDGQYIIAERNRFGYSQLVKVSLSTSSIGQVTAELTQKILEHVYDFLQLRPNSDGKPSDNFTYVSSTLNNKWQLKVRQLSDGQETIIPLPKTTNFFIFLNGLKMDRHCILSLT